MMDDFDKWWRDDVNEEQRYAGKRKDLARMAWDAALEHAKAETTAAQLAAMLTPEQRRGLLGEVDLGAVDGFLWMLGNGLVDGMCEATDEGRYVAGIKGDDQ